MQISITAVIAKETQCSPRKSLGALCVTVACFVAVRALLIFAKVMSHVGGPHYCVNASYVQFCDDMILHTRNEMQ